MFDLDLSKYNVFFVDMDGVVVKSGEPIPGAIECLERLREYGEVYVLSNNSTKSRNNYSRRMKKIGLDLSPDRIINSAFIVSEFLRGKMGRVNVYPIGEEGLSEELSREGSAITSPEEADVVVAGMDRGICYDKLAGALRALMAGAKFYATNTDKTFPTNDGEKPGAGATVGAITGMGFPPEKVAGKPSDIAVEIAMKTAGLSDPSLALMIGDRLETDIAFAENSGMDSVLTLTGVETEESLKKSTIQPDAVVEDLTEIISR